MTYAESFGRSVIDRHNSRLAAAAYYGTAPHNAQPMTGAEVALIIAILKAVIAGCDEFNPGWRQQLLNAIKRILPPWNSQIDRVRLRAQRALDPDRVGWLNQSQARADRELVLRQARIETTYHAGASHSATYLTDAILEQASVAPDAEIVGMVEELSRP